jgi:thioredoxin-related protein
VKKTLISLLLAIVFINALAQQKAEKDAPYLRFPTIPLFTLLKPDSTDLTRASLPKHKKTLIMYFSPSCDHCRHQTDSMIAHMDKFKDVQIVMATWQPFEEMKAFYHDYDLAKYRNIKMGRDTKYFFQPFYKIANLPFMALYDRNRKFITSFEGNTDIGKLVEAFQKKG